MLFGYPIAATQNNWLHDCMVETVKNVHTAVDAAKRHPAWPRVVPTAYQAILKPRHGLRDRLKAYDGAIRRLTKADRDLVLAALADQNRIADLLTGGWNCTPVDGLHQSVHEPVKSLFGFAFDLLTEFEVRDQLYEAIYAAAVEHMCPFCGTEYFDAPGPRREDLDHYLAKSRYPFAAANLRNLVPMGHRCNSSYKLASDLLHGANGARRVAFDPYNHTSVSVVLDDSDPFGGTTEYTPDWAINFAPSCPEVETWDDVFSIRERYRRSNLDRDYERWLVDFQTYVRSASLPADTDDERVDALRRYEEYLAGCGIKDRAFLKAAVFRMLRHHCDQGHQRLKDQLRDLLAPLVRNGGEVPA